MAITRTQKAYITTAIDYANDVIHVGHAYEKILADAVARYYRKLVGEENEIIAISQKGQVIRVDLKSIPSSGRQTQGVTVMKLRSGDSIASITCL